MMGVLRITELNVSLNSSQISFVRGILMSSKLIDADSHVFRTLLSTAVNPPTIGQPKLNLRALNCRCILTSHPKLSGFRTCEHTPIVNKQSFAFHVLLCLSPGKRTQCWCLRSAFELGLRVKLC